jgi:hypothetical protein
MKRSLHPQMTTEIVSRRRAGEAGALVALICINARERDEG